MTSTGQYVIAWDFAKVKKGQMDKYEIKKSVPLTIVILVRILTVALALLGTRTWSYKITSASVMTRRSCVCFSTVMR